MNGVEFLVYVLDSLHDDLEVISLALTALSLVVEGTSDKDFHLLGICYLFEVKTEKENNAEEFGCDSQRCCFFF